MPNAAPDPGYQPPQPAGFLFRKRETLSPEVKVLTEAVDQLAKMPGRLRQVLLDHQWASTALDVKERAQHPALTANTPLAIPKAFDTLVRITTILVILPTGATGGTLTLGSEQIPIVNNPFVLTPVNIDLNTNDNRTLIYTTGGPGPVYVLLTGQQLPTYGIIGG